MMAENKLLENIYLLFYQLIRMKDHCFNNLCTMSKDRENSVVYCFDYVLVISDYFSMGTCAIT